MDQPTPTILTPEVRTRITEVLIDVPVDAAYLFGSQATGKTGPMSDVDVGVLADESLDSNARFDLRLRLMSSLANAFDVAELDVVVLNDDRVPTLLRFNAIQPSVVIYDRNPRQRKQFEFITMRDYFGQYHYERVFGDTVRQAILSRRHA